MQRFKDFLHSIKGLFIKDATNKPKVQDLPERSEATRPDDTPLQKLTDTKSNKPTSGAQVRKRPSNTYVRLQALSASGTGAASTAPIASEGQLLGSMLDRLDDTPEKPAKK
jgi:hypothetical protein